MKGRAQFHQQLLAWYAQHGRHHLPWRQTDDPYAIWLSEVMLQQTQVDRVLERFYFPFLERFPTISLLAQADEQAVLKYWQGLGYYSRARNLHKAAQMTAPALPKTTDALMQLPGIGRNTAHAIAAFAFHQPVAILEANVKRIVARIFALERPSDTQLWDCADQLADKDNPFEYNQAMMDLGAMICTAKSPQCLLCPASDICKGKHDPLRYPQKKLKKALPTRHMAVVLFQDGAGRYFMQPRQTRFLNSLWAFVEVEASEITVPFQHADYPLAAMQCLGEITHSYSHFHLVGKVYVQPVVTQENGNNWYKVEEIAALPLSRTEQKILTLIG